MTKPNRKGTTTRCLIAMIVAAIMISAPQWAAASDIEKNENFVWKPVRGDSMPPGAFSAAPQGAKPVWLCRVRHNRDIEIGHIVNTLCAIGGDGLSRPYSLFRTLVTAPGVAWAVPRDGALPPRAVALNDGFGPTVHGCRVTHQGKTIVGMVRDGICSAGYNDAELRSDAYEVLVHGE